jgi:hypothetical protein
MMKNASSEQTAAITLQREEQLGQTATSHVRPNGDYCNQIHKTCWMRIWSNQKSKSCHAARKSGTTLQKARQGEHKNAEKLQSLMKMPY